MNKPWRAATLLLALTCFLGGCQQEPAASGPSYADLVVTYNAEIEALDRLETKRDTLIREYAQATAPNQSAEAIARLEGLLKSARDLKDGDASSTTSDPNELLDQLNERNAGAQDIANQALNELLGGGATDAQNAPTPSPEDAAASAEKKVAFEASLASLDAEIAQQKQRVERARQARDAAESSE